MIFPEYDTHCGWFEMLDDVSTFLTLSADARFETIIIGGGFVGVAAARRLAENRPDKPFLLIEALKIGQGASGRNSGFVIDLPHKRDLELGTPETQQKILKLNKAATDYLEQQINRFGIQCQWSRAGKYQIAVGDRGSRHLDHFEKLVAALGTKYNRLCGAELAEIVGTNYYREAIFTPGCILMQPAALMRGLADSLPENVRVIEETPVRVIERTHDGFVVCAGGYELRCSRIVLGTNIFTEELGFMKNRILPVMTYASMTRPLTEAELSGNYSGKLDWGITPADHAGTTMRMTQDRRIIIRNGIRYAHDYNTPQDLLPKVQQAHREGFDIRYPGLSHVPFEFTWGGASGLSGNFETFWGELEPGIYASCCDQSVGAARGTISGMMLADLIADKDTELLQDIRDVSGTPCLLPPKPLLRIGVPLRMAITRFTSRSEL